ncbi:MAG: transporter, family, multidrug resistance protein [Thermoproteota archaeon]|nr:transporter, family, multidrug resistance protein [Thermoproteota archaeon]
MQFIASVAYFLMSSFLPLFFSSELNETLINATYWAGVFQLIGNTATALGAPFWGYMCDRIGVKKVLLFTIMGNTIGYTGMAISNSIPSVMFFRGLQGCFGGTSTIMFSLVALVVPREKLKMALSYQITAMTMSQIAAPGIGGVIASILGFRFTFLVSAILYLSITLIILLIRIPPPDRKQTEGGRFSLSDLKTILPDAFSLILVYMTMNFITPIVTWFLGSTGIPYNQLLTFTAITTIISGLAYAASTPLLTKVITDKTMHLLSIIAAAGIFATAFVKEPYQFIVLRIFIGAAQSGIPPNLLGGKSGRKGTSLGVLNSARFMGGAIGPFMATSILGDGSSQKVLIMFSSMAGISLIAALFIYLTHTKRIKAY